MSDWISPTKTFGADWSGMSSVAWCNVCSPVMTFGPFGSHIQAIRFIREHSSAEHEGSKPCSIESCTLAVVRRGLCGQHLPSTHEERRRGNERRRRARRDARDAAGAKAA